MFEFLFKKKSDVSKIINESAAARITDVQFIELEIQRFKASKRRKEMIDGE